MPVMTSHIDHIVFCVDDLGEAARRLNKRFGLASHPGGRHSGHGTANHIVPLGSAYLELVAIVDVDEAAASRFGRWVGSKAVPSLAPHALCLRTDDLNLVCGRLDLEPISMSRTLPDGTELRWRLAGLDALVSRGLPFFIEWDIDPSDHPGGRGQGARASVEVTLTGDTDLLTEWVTGSRGVSVEPGETGVGSVTLRLDDRTFQL